ncbi:MAG: Inosose dehydratase [Candidatus Hydrogenedentes bacterium ADurb.Bin179]|nr:MAG: Inosose dehydratase [Candidatus Hydrogenedentes bacterium ADurb.Bin179]
MKRLLSLVDSPWIKCNYDSGNTFLAGPDPYEMLEAVIEKVVHVHAKDISVKQVEEERGTVTSTAVGCDCGDGVIDWKGRVERQKTVGYKGVLSVECGTEEEAVRSLAHLTKVLQELDACGRPVFLYGSGMRAKPALGSLSDNFTWAFPYWVLVF